MKTDVKNLPQSQIELTVEITPEEIQPNLIWAAEQLSLSNNIPGFRPGRAPFNVIKKQFGDMKILETALERIVKQTYFKAVQEKNLKTIGQPSLNVEKMAPNNPIIYKATVALLPTIKLADWKKIKIKRQNKPVTDADTSKVLEDIRKMRAKETLVDRAANKKDKVIVDMDIKVNNVPIEGGQAKNHSVYLEEDYYIPGLAEKLVGSKKDDVLEFTLPFPENFYQKSLSGKNADFKIEVKGVYERELPEVDEEFAKSLGQKNTEELKKVIQQNLQMEADQKEEQRLEIKMLQEIAQGTKFEDIPEILVNEEKQKMFAELKQGLTSQGITFEDYLKNIKKTEEEVAKDFIQGATERAKTALLLREIASEEKIDITPKDLEKELERVHDLYKNEEHIEERLAAPEIQDFIAQSFLNRRVLVMLKEQIIEKS